MTSTRRTFFLAIAASLTLWSLAACGDDDTTGPGDGNGGPTPGTLTVTLDTPTADDGAILFTVTGADMTQIAASDASLYFRYAQEGTTATAVLVGDVADGALLTFHVPDVDAAGSYGAAIQQVADRDSQLRADLGAYTLSVE